MIRPALGVVVAPGLPKRGARGARRPGGGSGTGALLAGEDIAGKAWAPLLDSTPDIWTALRRSEAVR
ncbi:hypothetical protein NDU88_003781 [Pleurodeles waltl]|uniref:Uncharacterized protein n=1 Tax=Pleurodeles waltl TaxID=8319 RepID=A0AAV7M7Z4_PLEWA|nr:hypothetical protein NDU88_003781 [Pleurodeles waltl]